MSVLGGEFHFWVWLHRWSNTLGVVSSAVLSFLLAVLYYEQKALKRDELNREIRTQHTEAIRKRIRVWLGMDRRGGDGLVQFENDPNLPSVGDYGIESANGEPLEDLQVVPERLEGDRYLEDFLQNHGTDVQSLCEELQSLHRSVNDLRNEYVAALEAEPMRLRGETFTLTPTGADFLFDQLLDLHRRDSHVIGGSSEEAAAAIGKATASTSAVAYESANSAAIQTTTASATVLFQSSDGELANRDRALTDEEHERLASKIEVLLAGGDYEDEQELARDAAAKLDRADDAVDDLENTLMEYEGKPIYFGDCDYVSEAEIDDDGLLSGLLGD